MGRTETKKADHIVPGTERRAKPEVRIPAGTHKQEKATTPHTCTKAAAKRPVQQSPKKDKPAKPPSSAANAGPHLNSMKRTQGTAGLRRRTYPIRFCNGSSADVLVHMEMRSAWRRVLNTSPAMSSLSSASKPSPITVSTCAAQARGWRGGGGEASNEQQQITQAATSSRAWHFEARGRRPGGRSTNRHG